MVLTIGHYLRYPVCVGAGNRKYMENAQWAGEIQTMGQVDIDKFGLFC